MQVTGPSHRAQSSLFDSNNVVGAVYLTSCRRAPVIVSPSDFYVENVFEELDFPAEVRLCFVCCDIWASFFD